MKEAILVEKIGRRRGIVLSSGGRFHRVRVPDGVEVGALLPDRERPFWVGSYLTAAILTLFSVWSVLAAAGILPDRRQARPVSYDLITLRFAQPMTLTIDELGKVAEVKPRLPNTEALVGMRMEQAIQHTVSMLPAASRGEVEVHPHPESTSEETRILQDRIRTALPLREPPIEVAVLTESAAAAGETEGAEEIEEIEGIGETSGIPNGWSADRTAIEVDPEAFVFSGHKKEDRSAIGAAEGLKPEKPLERFWRDVLRFRMRKK